MDGLRDVADPVRDALVHAESLPAEFASWTIAECLRRLRIRSGLNRKQLAAKAGVHAALIGRAEKGSDIRLSTLTRLYAALGYRLHAVPAGGLYEMDWADAHRDNEYLGWKRENARYLTTV